MSAGDSAGASVHLDTRYVSESALYIVWCGCSNNNIQSDDSSLSFIFSTMLSLWCRLRTVLDKLGINSLKKEQCIILSAIAESHDLFVQLPTGYGKSLAFVLAPFLKTPGRPRPTWCKGAWCVTNGIGDIS